MQRGIKQQVKTVAWIVLVILVFTMYANYTVYIAGRDGVYTLRDAPQAEAAVVLGARVYKNGTLSTVLADRMDTGIELYQAGKVQKLLLTGDHGQATYDEVNDMRRYAMARGVLKFHLSRALYIARAVGLEAGGVLADKREYSGMDYLYLRETLARTKAVTQVVLGMKPKYLGPAIPITGDGRTTKG